MSNDERGDPPNDGMDDDSTVPIGARLRQLMEISKLGDVEDTTDATVQVDLADLLARGGPDSTPAMEVSVALGSGPQEAASVGHVATKQMDVATLAAGFAEMNAGKAPEPVPQAEPEPVLSGPVASIVRQDTVTDPDSFPAPAHLPPPSDKPRPEPERPIERVTARVDMAEVARLLTEAAQKEAKAEADTGIKDLSSLAGNIVENVERGDPSLDVTIRGDMQDLLSGVMNYVRSEKSEVLDPETRAAMQEFAAELAGELAGELEAEALGGDAATARPRSPQKTVVEAAPTVRGAVPEAVSDLIELSGLQEIEDFEAPAETFEELRVPGADPAAATAEPPSLPDEPFDETPEMATIQVDASQLPAAIRLAPIPGATELRPMQPAPEPEEAAPLPVAPAAEPPPSPAAAPLPSEAQPLDLESLEERAQALDSERAAAAAASPSEPVRLATPRRRSSKKYLFATLLLLLLIGVLTAVAGYLAWRGGHLMFLEKMLGS